MTHAKVLFAALLALTLMGQACPPGDIVVEGDSITSGQGLRWDQVWVYRQGVQVPLNNAISGTGYTVGANGGGPFYTRANKIDAARSPSRRLFIFGGGNDLFQCKTAAQIEQAMLAWVNARKAAGWTNITVIAFRSTQASASCGLSAPQMLARRNELTDRMIALASANGYRVIEINDPRLQNPNNPAYFQSDRVHFNAAGQAIFGDIVRNAP